MFRKNVIAGVLSCTLLGSPVLGAEPITFDLALSHPTTVAYAPNGKQVAVGGLASTGNAPNDGLVLLVDSQNGRTQGALRHSGTLERNGGSFSTSNMVYSLAYAPDGQMLAVATALGLKLWNPMDARELTTLLGYGVPGQPGIREVTSVVFSPNGKLLAISGSSGTIELWDAQARRREREIKSGSNAHLAFARDGSLLASAEHHNRVHLWNVVDGKQVAEVHAQMGPLYGIAVDPASKLVAAAGEGGEKMWRIEPSDASGWRFVDEVQLTGQLSPARGVAFSRDGRLLVTEADPGITVFYDSTTKAALATLWAGGPSAFSPDGQRLAVAETARNRRDGSSKLSIWSVADILNADRLAEQARMAANELVRATSSEHPDSLHYVQPRALAVLGGPHSGSAAPTLIAALANREIKQKPLIATALGRVARQSSAAIVALAEAVRDDPWTDTRISAAMALASLPPAAAAPAVPALVGAALNDESPHVRSAAARVLQKIDPAAHKQVAAQARARGPLETKVVTRDGQRFYQGRALNEWIDRLTVSYVPNEIFGRPAPNEPLAAIRAFGADAVPVLIETLKDSQWTKRRAAAAGLEALGSQAAPAVDSLLDVIVKATAKDLGVAGAAADAVAGILKDSKQPPDRLVELASSDDPAVRLSAARSVAQIVPAHQRGLAVLKAALAEGSPEEPGAYMAPRVAPFSEQPSVAWLGKTIADAEAPAMERIRAAKTLALMQESALPAMSEMIKAIGAENITVSRQAGLAIQRTGPQAVPAVSDALKAQANARTRKRLAATLWGLGDEGRRALKELLEGDDAEALWWAAAFGTCDPTSAMVYQAAIRDALTKCGQPVAPGPPQQGKFAGAGFGAVENPSVAWSAKTLTDGDAPKSLRIQSASELVRAPEAERLPVLPAILQAIDKEQDQTLRFQLANVIQRMGPQAIPAVRAAIDDARSDDVRRELLRALYGLGKEAQGEVAQLLKLHPEYVQLLAAAARPSENRNSVGDRRLSLPEREAINEAERTGRPLANGDFSKGLDGWSVEGGAGAFRTFARGAQQALTTFGDHQDADTGRLFQCFKIPDDATTLTFKLHGGANREKTYVALRHGNYRHAQMTAKNDNTPFQVRFLLTPLRGEVVTLEIVDSSTDGWGFIGAEDFRIVGASELSRSTAGRASSAFDVHLRGANGQEIKGRVDPASDSFIIRSWDNPTKNTWTPQAKELPLVLYAFTADGQAYDVPDDWNGTFVGWSFLLPIERDLTNVLWNEGQLTEFWRGASFGWGGLRNSLGKVVAGKGDSHEARQFRYVPTKDNATSDIGFDAVTITPVRSETPAELRTDNKQ